MTRIMNLLSPIIWLLYIELLNGWTLPKLFRYWFSGEVDWFILAFHVFGFAPEYFRDDGVRADPWYG